MKKTDIIIFSKNRTLQLKSLIRSLTYYSDVVENEIQVLYTTEPDIPYEPLIKEFDSRFVLQKDFLSDLISMVETSESDYVFFMVDDLIFRSEFSLRAIETFLDKEKKVDCFSLRLGRNIDHGEKPDFSIMRNNILVWDTADNLGQPWQYFWEVSSSIYRKDIVRKYLRKCNAAKVNYPNPFESYYYKCMPSYIGVKGVRNVVRSFRFAHYKKSNTMACFETSKCFTQGVNLVAEREIEYKTLFEPIELHKKMEEGFIVDFHSLKDVDNKKPNVGAKYFKIIRDITR